MSKGKATDTGSAALLREIQGLRSDLRVHWGGALNKSQAAAYLNVSEKTLDRYVESGMLAACDMSVDPRKNTRRGRVTFFTDDLDDFRRKRKLITG